MIVGFSLNAPILPPNFAPTNSSAGFSLNAAQSSKARSIMTTKRPASDSESEIDVKPLTPTHTPKKVKPAAKATGSPKKPDAWTPERRLKLFDAFIKVADVKWDEVAAALDDGATGKMCREQWQRATGKKIREALSS